MKNKKITISMIFDGFVPGGGREGSKPAPAGYKWWHRAFG